MRWIFPVLLILTAPAAVRGEGPEPFALAPGTRVWFATVEEGRRELGRSDAFIEALSPFDRQARLKSEEPVSTEEFLEHVVAQVRPFTDAQRSRVEGALILVRQRLEDWTIPFPEQIHVIHTTGEEESGKPYTRGRSIVLPTERLTVQRVELARILTHELFHILSRNDGRLRERLYAAIGFVPCGPIELPRELAAARLTNPDAPRIEHRIVLALDSFSVSAVPVLYADPPTYDPATKPSLFDYLVFRLLAIEEDRDGRWAPRITRGRPELLDASRIDDYWTQVGGNTQYVIHPDEILADNFVLLLQGRRDVPTPAVLDRMREILGHR